MNYHQPSFYRFSEDSLLLVELAASQIKNKESIVDLGSGCGVIGLELAQLFPDSNILLVEKQESFKSSLKKNVMSLSSINISYIVKNLFEIDLSLFQNIIINPPYFDQNMSRLSPNLKRSICRSHDGSFYKLFFEKIEKEMSEKSCLFLSSPAENLNILKDFSLKTVKRYTCNQICYVQLSKT